MTLAPGTRLGVFEITALIGTGGMGRVYRATDTRLKRQVAIKVLPPSVTVDHDRLARFQREAEVLASLNHPHIAAIYGLEESDAALALVMELVEGEDLSCRIARGPTPLDDALPIARQIAEALEAAHEQGVIHRDLKPANIKIRDDGMVKVLDFGLAKAIGTAPGSSLSLPSAPTITSAGMTEIGTILGTAAYMSPEQARGRAVDKRSDVWAFGAVLFEMLSGERPFGGDGTAEVLANILKAEPDWSRLPADLPDRVRLTLRGCLQKDPRHRLGDVQSARLTLEGLFEGAGREVASPAPITTSRWRAGLLVVSGAAAVVAIAAILWSLPGPAPAAAPPTRTTIVVPANRPVAMVGAPTRPLALSPDGTQLVYVSTSLEAPVDQPGGGQQLEVRTLDTLAVRDLPGTAGANQPFFSPDGQWIAFFTGSNASGVGALKKVALAGGSPITLADKINASAASFGVWPRADTIVFGTLNSGLQRVATEGGRVIELTTLDGSTGEQWHSFPAVTPSGRTVLFSVRFLPAGTFRIDAVNLDSGERRAVLENARMPLVLNSGHLLFQRDDAVLVAPFDPERLTVTGPAVPLVDLVRRDSLIASAFPVALLAASQSGSFAYVPDADTTTVLGLVGRDGTFEALGIPPSNSNVPRASPTGEAIAYLVPRGQESEVFVYDRVRGTTQKLTPGEFDVGVAWHPDGRSLAIASRRQDTAGLFLKSLDGPERRLVATPPGVTYLRNASWSPDGRQLAYTVQTGLLHDVWIMTMGEPPVTEPLLASAASSEYSPAFSPNGHWLAYQSDESGRSEVYLQRYPRGERLVVSTGGGNGPVWRRDGKELFFEGLVDGVPKMMAVTIMPEGGSLRLGKSVALFDLRPRGTTGSIEQYARSTNIGAKYDVLPDGRFLMIRGPDPTGTREIVLVQHWFGELGRLAPKP